MYSVLVNDSPPDQSSVEANHQHHQSDIALVSASPWNIPLGALNGAVA